MTKDNEASFFYEFRFRRYRKKFNHSGLIDCPEALAKFIRPLFKNLDREVFYVIYLDIKLHVIGYEQVAVGTLEGVTVHPREVMRGALLSGAYSIILAHNHPSNDSTPSGEDIALTLRLQKVGELIGIPVLDHVVVTEDSFIAIEENMMKLP